MLEVKNLSFAYGDHVILNQVDLTLPRGQIYGLVAPNGTGKSTFIHLVMNFLVPSHGEIQYLTHEGEALDYSSEKLRVRMRRHIALLPEIDDLYENISGTSHLKLYHDLWGNQSLAIDDIIDGLHLANYIDRPVGTYSLGMKQRLCFAMIVATGAEVMLMDEVMNGLDPDNVLLVTNYLKDLKSKGTSILIASHLLDNLDLYADDVIFIQDQKFLHARDLESSGEYLSVPKELAGQNQITGGFPLRDRYLIPISDISDVRLTEMIEGLISQNCRDFKIESLGTSELYEKIYRESAGG